MIVAAIILLFLAMVALGFPIFVAMAVSGMTGGLLLGDSYNLLQNTSLGLYQSFTSFELIAVPLYILVGTLMERAQLSAKLFDFARVWFGSVRGGLGVATIVACGLFAAISGSSVATAATIGIVALPLLRERGYGAEFSGAMIAAGGTLGILIPPSIAMIVFGVITEQSIGALFIAGVVPGLLLAIAFAVYVALFSGVAAENVQGWGERLAAARRAAGALVLPVFIFGSIYSGLATPTEVAALAVAYVAVLGLTTGALSLQGLVSASLDAARTTVMIFLLVGCGRILTEFFTLSEMPQIAAGYVTDLGWSRLLVVTCVILLILLLGMFLEALSMILVLVPILFPIMMALGFDPLAFGIFMVLSVEAALITPPVGINLFMLCQIGQMNILRISKRALIYLGLMIALMYLVLFVPEIATWLPSTMN